MELKAFLKPICNIPASCESCNFSNVILAACMIISAAPLTPTPSCLDGMSLADSVCVYFAMRFAINPRKTSLTAIGRTPPFKFFKTVKEALQKAGVTDTESWPLLAKFTSFIMLVIACLDWSEAAQFTACKMCPGYILDEPASEKLGKASIWPNTVGSSNWWAWEL